MVRSNFLFSLFASAASVTAVKTVKKTIPGAYVVEFEDNADSVSFYSHVESTSETRMTFDYSLFKGASIQIKKPSSSDARNLLSMSNVKNVWPLSVHSIPKDEVIWTGTSAESLQNIKRHSTNESVDVFSPHVMTQVDQLRAEGIIGEGVKIGIIDTGVDYNHPALGGCFGDGCLVSYGYDLAGDSYDGYNTPVPDPDPYDGCEGHGTHVAGIIAAQANEFGFTGAAPGVTLGMYRVFGCGGSAADDILIDAYLQAFEDGSNIITASIGGSSGWSEEPWAVVVSRIVEQGVPCTVSAGNSGSVGLFYASTAANGKKVTAIASFDNVVSPMLLVTSYNTAGEADNKTFGYALGSPSVWAGVNLPLWVASYDVTDPAGGCDAYPKDTPDLSGYIVLIRRGSCNFVQKAQNAAAYGAQYIMFYNNVVGAIGATADGVDGILAVGMVTAEQGEEWVLDLGAGIEVVLDMLDPLTAPVIFSEIPNNTTGGAASYYTSWGPTFEADIKPQLGAPGGSILSTYPIPLGSYAVLSGTSMACPITAAIYALISNVRGTLDPTELENVLSTTSKPNLYNDATSFYPYLAPVPQVGSGLVQAYDAAYATTILSVPSLAFNDTDNLIDTLNFTISNTGAEDVTYDLANVGAANAYTFSTDIYPDIFPGLEVSEEYATLEFSESNSKVTVSAGGEAIITVTVTPPDLDASRLPVYSGYITLNATNGESLSLPYQGIVGSLHETTVLDGAYLSISSDAALNPITGDNSTFILPADNSTDAVYPVAVVSLAFGSPLVKIEVIAVSGSNGTNSAGNILGTPLPYLSRDAFNVEWNGQLEDGSFAPAGKYYFSVEALHIFGNESDPSEYDVSETVAFTIRYA